MAFTYTGQQVDLGFGRGWLDRPAADSILRIDRQLGHALQITEAGRDRATQQKHYDNYQRYGSPIALSPDAPSIHQKGAAIDSNEAQRIIAILEDHGWRRTVYRYVKGVWTLVEPWHFEYFPHLDNHRSDTVLSGGGSVPFPIPSTSQEDEMSTILLRITDGARKGTSYTLEPFRGIKGHANVAGARAALLARNGSWPPAEGPDFERFRSQGGSGEIQVSEEHARWIADVYGLAPLLPFPAPGELKRL